MPPKPYACAHCGRQLRVADKDSSAIWIQPCPDCLADARDDARSKCPCKKKEE